MNDTSRSLRARFGAVLTTVLAFVSPIAAASSSLVGRPLHSIRFVCDAPIDEEDLRTLLPLEVGEPVTEQGLEEARRLLELREVFREIDLELQPEGDGAVLVIELKRKLIVRKVGFSGLESISDKQARRLVRLDELTIYDPDLVEAARARLHDRYVKMAFVDAEVMVTTEEGEGEIELTFHIDEGQPLIVSAVTVTGDEVGDLEATLLEKARDLEGERRTREAVRAMDQGLVAILRNNGFYEARVSSEWEATAGNEGIVRFRIDRGPPFEIEFTGNVAKDRDDLLGLMDLETRLIVTDGTWRELGRLMREAYEDSGYYEMKVSVDIEDNGVKRVRFTIDEGQRFFVSAIRFEGNDAVEEGALRGEMVTAPRRWFPWPRSGVLVDEVLAEDLKRLRFFYRTQGFRSAKVVEARKMLDRERGRIELTIVVEEGPRTVVAAVDTGAIDTLVAQRADLGLAVGQPLNPELLKTDREAIAARLRRAGYAEPAVEAKIDETRAGETIEAAVRWEVEPGARQRIGRIVIQRNIDTRSRAIRRVLQLREGDPLAVEDLLQGQVDLYRLGLFRSVAIRPITPQDQPVRDVGVSVSERPAGSFELGAGYNTRDGLEGVLDVGYKNVGGMARAVNLRLQASLDPNTFVPDQYLATLGFVEPRLFGSRWRYKATLLGERSTETVDDYSIERVGFVNIVDRPLAASLNGGLEAQVEAARVFDVASDAVLSSADEGKLRTVALTPFLLYDTRDDPFLTKRGLLDSARLRYGLPTLSTVQFAKLTTQHTQFFPLIDDVVFVYSARIGWAHAISGSDFVPIRERFFLGGRTTVRGFGENSIGPRGAEGSEIGGDFYVNLNVELRFPLFYGLGGALFADGGGLYLLQCDSECRRERGISQAAVSLDNFRRSAGVGLRYNTPVGPIAFDYGIKLDRRDGESFGRFHFSIGTIF